MGSDPTKDVVIGIANFATLPLGDIFFREFSVLEFGSQLAAVKKT